MAEQKNYNLPEDKPTILIGYDAGQASGRAMAQLLVSPLARLGYKFFDDGYAVDHSLIDKALDWKMPYFSLLVRYNIANGLPIDTPHDLSPGFIAGCIAESDQPLVVLVPMKNLRAIKGRLINAHNVPAELLLSCAVTDNVYSLQQVRGKTYVDKIFNCINGQISPLEAAIFLQSYINNLMIPDIVPYSVYTPLYYKDDKSSYTLSSITGARFVLFEVADPDHPGRLDAVADLKNKTPQEQLALRALLTMNFIPCMQHDYFADMPVEHPYLIVRGVNHPEVARRIAECHHALRESQQLEQNMGSLQQESVLNITLYEQKMLCLITGKPFALANIEKQGVTLLSIQKEMTVVACLPIAGGEGAQLGEKLTNLAIEYVVTDNGYIVVEDLKQPALHKAYDALSKAELMQNRRALAQELQLAQQR